MYWYSSLLLDRAFIVTTFLTDSFQTRDYQRHLAV